jgi:hypothetical protein
MGLGPKYPLSNLLPPGMRGKLQILYPLMMFVADWTNDETIKIHKDHGNSLKRNHTNRVKMMDNSVNTCM